ncbi:DUF4240 domain-containing protein [Streptomyces sp. NBC_01571]|uniref:DUF4240 domain-containing protein n=1 Tax=Streptomyces sp. NBC_01571 TaxID=2975883 RepID=UPI0033903559
MAQGREWYDRAATAPDVLAQHPDVIAAAAERSDEALFNETVNYAASYAYERINENVHLLRRLRPVLRPPSQPRASRHGRELRFRQRLGDACPPSQAGAALP